MLPDGMILLGVDVQFHLKIMECDALTLDDLGLDHLETFVLKEWTGCNAHIRSNSCDALSQGPRQNLLKQRPGDALALEYPVSSTLAKPTISWSTS
jgi:hypothetical protein